MSQRKALLLTTALTSGLAMAAGGVANAADWSAPYAPAGAAPAVSDINGKVAAGFGAMNEDLLGLGLASLTVPLGPAFGFQADALIGNARGNGAVGIAGHGFWRDPARGLLGLYGSYLFYDGPASDIAHAGLEGEAYFGRVSVEGLAGVEFADGDTSAFGSIGVAFYPTDDLRLHAGYRHFNELGMAALGFEYQPRFGALPGLALFAEGRLAESDNWAAYAGLRFYFGADKSLIRRHREDDPVNNYLPDDLFGLASVAPPAATPTIIVDGLAVPD